MIEATAWKKHQGGTFGPSAISASQLCKEILFQLLIHPKTKASKALIETLIQTISEMLEAAPQRDANPLHFTGQAKDPRIKTALALLEENFHRSFSIEEIARKSGLSTRSFNRLFLTELAVTPKQAMTLYRVERAKQLLRQGKGSVTDIAFEVGYQSVSQFIATFRRHTGQLPSSLLR
jgi:transcriptional regulator GlxA family with amidase domain